MGDIVTDSERREVAARLRELADANEGLLGGERMTRVLGEAQRILGTVGLASVADVLRRYADLIDRPACENFGGEEGTNGEGYEFACAACGFMAGDAGDWRYCPMCGAEVVR